MILDFRLMMNSQIIRVSAPQGDLEAELPNVVGCLGPNRQIVAIGDTAADIQRNAPAYWARYGKQIEFVHPFDFGPDGNQFEPLLAARIVQWLSDKAFARMKRSSFSRLLLGPWVDRVDYALTLVGYDRLSEEQRRQFVRYLKKLLVAIRRVEINGVKVLGR